MYLNAGQNACPVCQSSTDDTNLAMLLDVQAWVHLEDMQELLQACTFS